MTSIIIYAVIFALCVTLAVLYHRAIWKISLRQDERIKALSQELAQNRVRLNDLHKHAEDNFAHYSREIHEIHSRLKRCETALGIESGRRNVRGENNEKRNRSLGEGSPLPATYAQRAPRTKSK